MSRAHREDTFPERGVWPGNTELATRKTACGLPDGAEGAAGRVRARVTRTGVGGRGPGETECWVVSEGFPRAPEPPPRAGRLDSWMYTPVFSQGRAEVPTSCLGRGGPHPGRERGSGGFSSRGPPAWGPFGTVPCGWVITADQYSPWGCPARAKGAAGLRPCGSRRWRPVLRR